MFEKIKEWFNEVPVPPAWVQSIQSMILTQDALLVKQRDRIESLEKQLAVVLKQIDNDALVVANLIGRVLELEANNENEEVIQDATIVQLKIGDKVRVRYAVLGEDFDGKTGRIISKEFSELGMYTVRFPRKIQDSAIHEFYDDEIELVEE